MMRYIVLTEIKIAYSGVAQWQRAGLITQRSVDRNFPPLVFYVSKIKIRVLISEIKGFKVMLSMG